MSDKLAIDKLRNIIEDAHVNFLIGAGSSAELFDVLGDIENALTLLASENVSDKKIAVARASVYAKFFDGVIVKNIQLIENPESAETLLATYRLFLKSINRILLRRRSSLLNKQVNIFTTNVDLAFEVALDQLGMDMNDGFTGKFIPLFDTGNFGALRQRRSLQYENLSEVPTFNLVKIHGSVGWKQSTDPARNDELQRITFDNLLSDVRDADTARQKAQDSLVAIGADEKISILNGKIQTVKKIDDGDPEVVIEDLVKSAEQLGEDANVEDFMTAYEKLAVVNPTKEKFQTTVLNENYYDLFRILANELEKEGSVLFVIGFSFRDEHIRKLIVRAARTNPTLQVYVFCFRQNTVGDMEALIDATSIKNGNISFIGPDEMGVDELDLKSITENYFEPIVPERDKRPDQSVEVVVKMEDVKNDSTDKKT